MFTSKGVPCLLDWLSGYPLVFSGPDYTTLASSNSTLVVVLATVATGFELSWY